MRAACRPRRAQSCCAALGAAPACRLTLLCAAQVNELKSSIKFQLKKVLCMGVAIGNVGMEEKEIYVNTQARLPPRAPSVSSTLCLRGTAPRLVPTAAFLSARLLHAGFFICGSLLFCLHAIATGRFGAVGG